MPLIFAANKKERSALLFFYMNSVRKRLQGSFKAFAIHLSFSVAVAALAAVFVFYFWYPEPYTSLLGGTALFGLIVAVDVICGPLLTLILFDKRKSNIELTLDLALVACVQLGALLYGTYTMAIARPIYLAYELDRFRVVSQADIEPGAMFARPLHVPAAGWTGPKLIAIRVAKPDDFDYLSQVELSINGTETAYRPDRWDSYKNHIPLALEKANPIAILKKKYPDQEYFINSELKRMNLDSDAVLWLPIQSRRSTAWVALISANSGEIVGFLPLDGF